MVFLRLQRRPIFRLFSSFYPILLILAIAWGEILNYYCWRFFWNIPQSHSDESLGILIVADPQLIGYRNENHMIGPLTRWDCDRFLSKGFAHAVSATSPDLIIFLGDLFDEGVEAHENEINWTLTRFGNIYNSEFPKIFISGDNDVGGEMGPVQSLLTTRFRRLFTNSFPTSSRLYNQLTVTEVNLMNSEVHEISSPSASPHLNVILSHVSFAYHSYYDSRKFVETLKPDLVLSAHDHKSYAHWLHRISGDLINTTDLTGIYEVQNTIAGGGESVVEMQSPTCSYRMGVYNVGYGFLRIEPLSDDGLFRISFSILWLSSRFYALLIYSFLVTFGIVALFIELTFILFTKRIRYMSLFESR